MSTILKGRPWMTVSLDPEPSRHSGISGKCANCGQAVYESEFTLDDAYGVWRGECPKCKAINLLDFKKAGRGYSSHEMFLCLPTDHEMKMNNWLEQVPIQKCGCRECLKPTPIKEIIP